MPQHTATIQDEDPRFAIRMRGLSKSYPGGQGVKGLTLNVPRGAKFGLLGPNGAGKSTTLKMLMGLILPSAGSASVLGSPIGPGNAALRARLGYVPERHHIYPWMTVGEVMWFTRAFYPRWNETLSGTLLRQYGLEAQKQVRELSHGMMTKLALTLALSHEPEVLLLDEPTTGLDPLIREEFLEGILHPLVAESEQTVLLSSHIMTDIEKLADTVAIVNEGDLLACAPLRQLVRDTKRITARMADGVGPGVAPAGTIWQRLEDTQWTLTVSDFSPQTIDELREKNTVVEVAVQDLALEDIFKDYIKGARQS